MKSVINIEMTEKGKTIDDISAETGMTKNEIIETYNSGLTIILQRLGQADTSKDIHVDTQVYDDNIFNMYMGRLSKSDLSKVTDAIDTIKNMIGSSTGGMSKDGIDYPDLIICESKTDCLNAINILRDFINKCVPEFEE